MNLNSKLIILFTCVVTSLFAQLVIVNISYAIENDKIAFTSEIIKNSTHGKFESTNDITRPSISIISPAYPPTVTTGKIIIQGTANDSESGIQNVSTAVHVFPFNGNFPVPLGSQPVASIPSNWSHWSVPLIINTTGTYRVVVEARDNAGNTNYAETTINAALPKGDSAIVKSKVEPKISFVRPKFTEAAYQEHGFYRFYFKYGFPPFGKNITTDLDMLTVKTPKSVPEFEGKTGLGHLTNITSLIPVNGTELRDVSQDNFPFPQKFWIPFIDNVKKVIPNATLTVMRDEDVHDGHIFASNNNSNAYDILLLFHNEYVTQQEYDHLKQFVKNGGTITFIDANALYAEVYYDSNNRTITLVKGHDWEFDGKVARRSVPERWFNETKEWVGGNYLLDHIKNKVSFTNNPFNYTHFEEQYVNNPHVEILIDYGIKFSPSGYFNDPSLLKKQVASYILQNGKGKVIMLGLSARLLAENQEFMQFFRNAVLPNAICPKFISCILENPENDYTPPSIKLSKPAYPPTITTGKVIIEGVTSDINSGIANVSASINSFPISGNKPIKLELNIVGNSNDNLMHWRIPFIINETGTYRILVNTTDEAGNRNYVETTINAAIHRESHKGIDETTTKISFVRPTFTEAANQQHGFFDFFIKYGFPPFGTNITTDLDMLTVKTPKSVSEFAGNDIQELSNITSLIPINGTELHDATQNYFPNPQTFWVPFIDHVKNAAPSAVLTVMRDEDVHDGHIFYSDNRTNAYDILLLFHNEYVTQQEYDNLKQFVKNGGTIIFIDANALYAEVRYDGSTQTIALVKGHDWKFDGKSASRSVPERWYNVAKEWIGSNFLNFDTNVTFTNNPFNYTHFEEQFVNNPNAKIIIDYGVKFSKEFADLYSQREKLPAEIQREHIPIEKIKVATYSLDYGRGKVIMFGISISNSTQNSKLMNFFDQVFMSNELCPMSKSC